MKKLLFLFLTIGTLKAQTVDTTITFATAARVQPIIVKQGFPQVADTITHVGFFNYVDDLKGNCVVNYTLIATNRNAVTSSYQLKKSEYDAWDSSNVGLLAIIGNYLNLIFP